MRKTRQQEVLARSRWFWLGLLLIILLSSELARATLFNSTVDGREVVVALSEEAREALNNGVSLTFDCQFSVRQSYWLLTLSRETKYHQFRIVRHALSNRYIVHRDDLQTPRIFRSIDEATNNIADQSIKLLESYNETSKPFSMKLSLNKFDLPGPMRLNAFISSAWTLDTGWVAWRFAN